MQGLLKNISNYLGAIIFLVFTSKFLLQAVFLYHPLPLFQASYCLSVSIAFLYRKPIVSSHNSPKNILVALINCICPLLYQLEVKPGSRVAIIGTVLGVLGICISFLALLDLWNSFSIFISNRGIKQNGLYALVRHPIYFGYTISSLGFVFCSPTLQNLLIFLLFTVTLCIRIAEEENFLNITEEYRNYTSKVKYRIFPWVY